MCLQSLFICKSSFWNYWCSGEYHTAHVTMSMTHICLLLRLPSSPRKSFRYGSVFKDRKASCTVTMWTNKLQPGKLHRLRVQEAAHRSRTHSCFNARAPGEQLPSLMSFSVGMNRHWSKFMWLSESTHITLLFEKQISPLQKKPENIIPTALASVEAELFLHVQ